MVLSELETCDQNLLDASRAGDVLAWKPTHSLAEGLEATARWFFDQKNYPQ